MLVAYYHIVITSDLKPHDMEPFSNINCHALLREWGVRWSLSKLAILSGTHQSSKVVVCKYCVQLNCYCAMQLKTEGCAD